MRAGVRISRCSSSFPYLTFPTLSSAPRCLRCNLHLSAATSPKECELTEENDNFLQWLRHRAGAEISKVLSIGNSSNGRSLFASKNIKAGEIILEVPYIAQMTSQNLSPEIELLLPHDIGSISRLALVLLAEKKIGLCSGWFTYVNCLPSVDEMHSPIFWSDDELEMIRESSVYQETISQQAHIKMEFSAIKSVLEQFPKVFGEVHLDNFMHAYALVSSRAWETSNGVSLIPFADFLNHDGTCDAVLLSDVDKEISEVIADRDYATGEQVMIRYGKFSNATLLLDFGFTLPYNIYDQLKLSMDIPLRDPLYKMKSELLDNHSIPRITRSDKANSSGYSFVIKEVKSASSKGKGIPQALRAFVRVLSTTSIEELQALVIEAAENDGRLARRSLKSHYTEMLAHRILSSEFSHMMRRHGAALEALKTVDATYSDSKRPFRARMARDLLEGELRIMHSAYLWLTNYCKSLAGVKKNPWSRKDIIHTCQVNGELEQVS